MDNQEIYSCFLSQKKKQMKIEKESPYYVGGEWEDIVRNRLPNLQKIIDYNLQDFFTIDHVAGPAELTRHPYLANRVSKYIKEDSVICEIGAGIGGVCYNILSRHNPSKKIKYILFDIPEVLFMASCFLNLRLGEDYNIYCYDGEATKFDFKKVLEDHDLILLPHYLVEQVPKKTINCFINTGSFCEMNEKTCKNYFYKILNASKSSSTYYFEFRKKEELQIHPGFSPKKNEIYVDPLLHECSQELGYNLKSISKQSSIAEPSYWEVVYEN